MKRGIIEWYRNGTSRKVVFMAENSKIKLLYVLQIMEGSDKDHPMNTKQVEEKLAERGIVAERKSIARDIKCIQEAGYPVVRCENQNLGWYMSAKSHKK